MTIKLATASAAIMADINGFSTADRRPVDLTKPGRYISEDGHITIVGGIFENGRLVGFISQSELNAGKLAREKD